MYILLVTIFAFGFNVPKFLEFKVRNAPPKRLVECEPLQIHSLVLS